MKIPSVLTALACALALGSGLLAQEAPAPQPPAGQAMGHDWTQSRMAEKLNLTDTQKANIRGIIAKHKSNLMAKGKAAKEARRAFFDAMQKPETSASALRSLHRAMSDAGLEALLERRAMRQEIRAVLNPDQREQAALMLGRREGMRMAGGRFGGWRGQDHHRPDGPPSAN